MQRRDFLKTLAGLAASSQIPWTASAADALGDVLPTLPLGRTGEQVTMLGLGGYHIGWTTEELAAATIEAALEEGVRFFDTAESYGPGTSEERYGKYLVPKYRDKIFLMTKTTARDGKIAREHLEGSLRRLKTDRLDLWQIHSLESPQDVDERIAHGVVAEAQKAQAEGKVRHLGFTGHADPRAHLRMLECFAGESPFATVQMPINPADAVSGQSFIGSVLPILTGRKYGTLAMKTLADGRFFGRKKMGDKTVWETPDPLVPGTMSVEEAQFFAWSLPVSVLITGAENPPFLREKAALARKFVKMDEAARLALTARLAERAGLAAVEYYKKA